jgi:hypothetical protein
MRILGIDPGPFESGYVIWDGSAILERGYLPNQQLLQRLTGNGYDVLAIEGVVCYKKVVGRSTFETCIWIGRFDSDCTATIISEPEVRQHITYTRLSSEPQVRRALLDRFGEQGTKAAPGPLYGITAHLFSALAVAVTAWDRLEAK